MKKLTVLIMSACLAGSVIFAGCGSDKNGDSESVTSSSTTATSEAESSSESGEVYFESELLSIPVIEDEDWNIDDCIELGNYMGIELEQDPYAVSTEEAEGRLKIEAAAELGTAAVEDADATAEYGDVATIAYVGTKDGVAFDGGSADSYDLTLGSGTFIDGFEDGVVGMKVGETKDLNLTFPTNYSSEELAGADVVFTVTLNGLARPDGITNAWLEEYTDGQYTSVVDYIEDLRESMEQDAKETSETTLKSAAMAALSNSSTIKAFPREYLDIGEAQFESQYTAAAEEYGMELEDYLEAMGAPEGWYSQAKEYTGRLLGETLLLIQAVDASEHLSENEEEMNRAMETYANMMSVTVEEMEEQFSEDVIKNNCLAMLVQEFLVENAKITIKSE